MFEGIEIDIPSVSADTLLSELTIEQFVQLFVQLDDEIEHRKLRRGSALLEKMQADIGTRLKEKMKDKHEIDKFVREMQLIMIERMGALIQKDE